MITVKIVKGNVVEEVPISEGMNATVGIILDMAGMDKTHVMSINEQTVLLSDRIADHAEFGEVTLTLTSPIKNN